MLHICHITDRQNYALKKFFILNRFSLAVAILFNIKFFLPNFSTIFLCTYIVEDTFKQPVYNTENVAAKKHQTTLQHKYFIANNTYLHYTLHQTF